MKLRSFRLLLSLLILIFSSSSVLSEEKIDIWKNKKDKTKNTENIILDNKSTIDVKSKLSEKKDNANKLIKIENSPLDTSKEMKVFGIYDPADYNFNLNMWSSTKAEDVKSSIKRLEKIKLSKTSSDIFENILLSFSYPPKGMTNSEFVKLKLNWMINNNRSDLIENFLSQNDEFDEKSKAVQYLVDENIAQANIKAGCEKIKFIDTKIKDSYLEKFKIYCLVFDNQKSKAQLLLDLLREQNQSDPFFDDKIDFILGISKKTSSKINEKNLLNFYLSSITIENFKYEPTKKTKKEIWKYLNAANLIKLEDYSDKKKIKDLELAAQLGQIDEKIIFNIYKQMPFNLNTLINAKNLYQTLDKIDARALIFQKYLLSEEINSKVEYLFLLEDLFKQDDLGKVFVEFLSDRLEEIGPENMPEEFKELAENRILRNKELLVGKVKYNDKVFHQSKIIKFYIEGIQDKKIQKDLDKILKKISKNKKYFYSAKDLALLESLSKDGFKLPENLNYKDLKNKYNIPKNLIQLIEKNQKAFLALKIVEIIGEDEPHQLDPETVYFVINLLNETDLIKIRNKVIISALPQRV